MPPRSAIAWLSAGLTCGCLAALLTFGAGPLHDYIERRVVEAVQQQVVWSPDSPEQVQARFADNSDPSMPPLRARFHFLNITNLEAVRQGAKPELQEVGPYVFQSVKVKRRVEFVRDGDAVRYHEYRYFLPLPELSNGSMDDPITTLNVPLVGAVEVIGSLGVWKARRLLQMLAAWVERWGDPRVQGLFTTRTVGELLFGYEDQLLRQLSRFVPKLNPSFGLQPNMTGPEQADAEAPTQANTGLRQLSHVWQMELWRNISEVTTWAPPHLEHVRGSDGVQFRPGLALGDRVELWLGEIYRAVTLVAQEEVQQSGVPLLRMRFDPAASDVDPRFYQYVRGLWNITSPTAGGPSGKPGQAGPPIFLSRPHYCDADPALAAGVHGLACQPELHESHLDVEPNTGITLGASVKLMMSSWFGRKWSMIDAAVQDTYLPIMWVEIVSQAGREQLRQLQPLLWARAAQRFLLQHAHLAAAGLAAVAFFCLSLAVVLWSGNAVQDGSDGAAGSSGGSGGSAAANGRLDAAERAEQREPLLPRSFPVAAEEDGKQADEEPQADGSVNGAPEQQQAQGPGLVGSLFQRLRGTSAAAEAVPAAALGPASHAACGLPTELANFQGYYECADAVKVGRPKSVEELQAMVGMFPRVKASGVGHSWFKEMFCAGNDSRSLNVVMTELQPTLDMMTSPVDPKTWRGKTVPASFPIQVDELAQTVTVAAGITQRVLLDYLAEYKYWKQPSGWTLPAFSWFLDQTIGGAAATASHGSSMKWGSLSSQLVSLKMVLANGTLAEFSPRKNPHLFNAVGASVGRLGVVTELTFRIVPQQAVQRTLKEMSFDDFVNQLQETQADYVAAKQAGDVDGMKRALFQVHETQAFWALPGASVQRVDYEHLDKEPSSVMLNIMPGAEPLVKSMSGPEDDIFAQQEKKAVAANARMPVNPRFWSNLYVSQLRPKLVSGTFESRKSYLSMSESETAVTSTFAPYRQHEVAIPMSRAASCLEEVGKEVYGPAKLWEGARTPFLLRFITAEDLYLSPAHGEPAMYINFEDYVSLSTGKPNEQFEQIARLFRERCGARWHWGKEGWTRHAKCFDGAKEYPKWCHFGCAVQELDPSGKFASEWDGWRFNATRGSAVVPFASCCSPQGFSAECQCASRGSCK